MKWCEIELRWQLTANILRFWLQQTSLTLNDLELQFTACRDQTAELESRGFRYKVALYLSYLHMKFDYVIKGNPFESQPYIPISLHPNWRIGLALYAARFRSYWDL